MAPRSSEIGRSESRTAQKITEMSIPPFLRHLTDRSIVPYNAAMQLFSPFCPSCRENLARNGDSFTCSRCGRVYPLKNGVVDFLTSLPLSDIQVVVQKTFDAMSPSYDNAIVRLVESLSCPWSTYTARLEAFMADAGGKIILDVGCGTSFPVGSFMPQNSIYLGMDISLEMLGHARRPARRQPERRPVEHRRREDPAARHLRRPLPRPDVVQRLSQPAEGGRGAAQGDQEGRQRVRHRVHPAAARRDAERAPRRPGLVREVFSIFDSRQWDLSIETQGGVLFFHLKRAAAQ